MWESLRDFPQEESSAVCAEIHNELREKGTAEPSADSKEIADVTAELSMQ